MELLKKIVTAKIARWLLFGIVFPVVPLAANYLWLGLREEAPDFSAVLRNGELLLVTSIMCATALGEIIGTQEKYPIAKIVAGGLTAAIMMLAIMLFVNISEVRLNHGKISDVSIMSRSLIAFCFGIITCTSCVALSEAK